VKIKRGNRNEKACSKKEQTHNNLLKLREIKNKRE
jgi:hypothetical protein